MAIKVKLVTVQLTEWYDDLPPGSVIHGARLVGNSYAGIWTSSLGTYNVVVPSNICKVRVEDE